MNKCQIIPISNITNVQCKKTHFKFDIGHLRFEIPRNGMGFTLIEILVTIAIMIMVFGFIVSSASALQRRQRDQQRKTDLQNIQAALAQYYADQQFYPDLVHSPLVLSSTTQLNDKTGNNIATATKIYLVTIPLDPNGVVSYCYKPQLALSDSSACDNSSNNTTCHYYQLCAQLEDGPNSVPNCSTGCSTFNYHLNSD